MMNKDIELEIEGLGIVMYSPKNTENLPEGYDFLSNEYSRPNQVAEHLKKGDIVGFCTGSGGKCPQSIERNATVNVDWSTQLFRE